MKYQNTSFLAIFSLLYSSTNKQQFEKRISTIQVVTLKITDDLNYEWKPSCAYFKIHISFTVRKDEWGTKESTGKSMKDTLYTAACQNALLRLKQCRAAKKIKPTALVIAKLH